MAQALAVSYWPGALRALALSHQTDSFVAENFSPRQVSQVSDLCDKVEMELGPEKKFGTGQGCQVRK
jgi:hypothetical protein